MYVHELKEKFLKHKSYVTDDVNTLLDFAKKAYIFDEISVSDYKKIVRELEMLGAKLPFYENKGDLLIEG
jgi:hypothetical protein